MWAAMRASVLPFERNGAGSTGFRVRTIGPQPTLRREVRSRKNIRSRRQRSGQKQWGTTMRIERRNTTQGHSPYDRIDFRLTTSEIRNPDGSVVFRLENVEVPEFWSQVASDVLAQKYFRKAGVAARLKKV